jgi:thiol-disulfide isomerase/thioredoxin
MTMFQTLMVLAAAVTADPRGELLEFSATWCGPCQRMSPIVSRL